MDRVRLDSNGIASLLKSQQVATAVHNLAEQVADNVRGVKPQAEEIVVDDYTTDRAASSVTVKDPRGRIWQARDGVLTRSAAAAGLEVTER